MTERDRVVYDARKEARGDGAGLGAVRDDFASRTICVDKSGANLVSMKRSACLGL
jgi:hypothetical protein